MNSIDWLAYYRAQAGGEYNYFHGSRFQEGYGLGGFNIQQGAGLGGMFRKFASWIIPMVKKYAVPSLRAGANAIGREALESASNVAKEFLAGVDVQEAVKNRLNRSVDNLKTRAENALEGRGGGIKGRKKMKNLIILKKLKKNSQTKFKDIFT